MIRAMPEFLKTDTLLYGGGRGEMISSWVSACPEGVSELGGGGAQQCFEDLLETVSEKLKLRMHHLRFRNHSTLSISRLGLSSGLSVGSGSQPTSAVVASSIPSTTSGYQTGTTPSSSLVSNAPAPRLRFNGGHQVTVRPMISSSFAPCQVREHTFWNNASGVSGDNYNYQIIFGVDQASFLMGVHVIAIGGDDQGTEFVCDVQLFENRQIPVIHKRVARTGGGLEGDTTSEPGGTGRQNFTVLFGEGIPLEPENEYSVEVILSSVVVREEEAGGGNARQ